MFILPSFSQIQPYFVYNIPLWGSQHSTKQFNDLFILQKKAIRIITNKTTKIDHKFHNTKQLFQKTNILTIHNLYYYLSASESKKILDSGRPSLVYDFFHLSSISNRLILPKFSKEKFKSNSFIHNASKIINYFSANKILYSNKTQSTFKILLKRHLISQQSASLNGDPNWLPCNLNIFSDTLI